MKKIFTILFSILLTSTIAIGQHGFVIEVLGGGPLETIDLLTGVKTPVGTTMNSFSAGDLGANDIFYAINYGSDELYQIDTTDGATTLIASITPPVNHIWTGMAYDEFTGIMYGYSAYGVATGEGSLHIIDVSDGSYTLVGTQTTATAIGCIAIDGTGQMYGMDLEALAKIYAIDKDDGSVTLIGNTGQGAAGMGHGMDWSNANETMYLTTYNSSTFANTLRVVDLTNGSTTQVGPLLGGWTAVIAIPGSAPLAANFTSDITDVCAGGVVSFTDQSSSAISWDWTFEGGTPATSTDQNPTVTYNTTGDFDVTLIVSDGTSTDTKYIENMITVTDIPTTPDTPDGDDATCTGNEYTYTTMSVDFADSYTWEVLPADAGIITGTDITAIFEADDTWTGSYTIKVMATNSCGNSAWSSELACTLSQSPTAFFLAGGGSFCEGGAGLEITLDGSETGVDYELFMDGVSTGNIVAGTGNPISFGYQTVAGNYNSYGNTASCSTLMYGEAYLTVINLPTMGSQPTGPVDVCSGTTTDYQTEPIADADELIWTLNPIEAGTIIGNTVDIMIEWSSSFSGLAYLSVYGTNDCGDGLPSDDLEITVLELPTPVLMGETMVCEDEEYIYSTEENAGSTYAWVIQGGNIVSGSGSSEIIVLWTTVGVGTVLVTETSGTACEGISDTLFVEVDECTGINETKTNELLVYPNPAKNYLIIDLDILDKFSIFDLIIYNQYGQEVYKVKNISNKESYKVNTESFPTGIYFVEVLAASGVRQSSKIEVVK